jgi:hypothetical protein
MAVYSNTVSTITYSGTTFEAVGSMAISASRPPFEITQVGSANAHFIPGIISTAIALDIYYNKAHHQVFVDALMNGTSASFAFNSSTSASDGVSGSAYVIGCDVVSSMGDIVRGSITLQATGQITFAGTSSAAGGNEV